jgi:von Willebrand factor type A domain
MTHPSRIKAGPSIRLTRAVPLLFPIALVGASSAWWGCSATDDTQVFNETTGTTTTTTGSGGGGGAGGSPAGTGGDVMFDAGQMDAPINDAGACVATEAQAELIPLDMIILLDRSGSMSLGGKWDGSTDALKTFVNDPASAGINVGIVYYPIDSAAESCDFTLYDDLVVPVGELPGNAPALVASIDAEDPNGADTPTYGALKGALFNATAYQDANPTHKVIVVFASDGDPNGCGAQDAIPEIAALASSAVNYNGVQTYVIAIQGATLANLNQIALAGGTMQAYDVTANVAQFSQKMAEIRAAALSCEFIIPDPPEAQELDPEKINVSYTPGGQGSPQTLPQATNLADCGAGAGWYYDNNTDPTKILLCPASCTTVQADSAAAIGVLFGCKTEVN